MKPKNKTIIYLILILVILLTGCSDYNEDVICEKYCSGEPLMESKNFLGTHYIRCTAPDGWNLSSYSEGYLEVRCDVPI